MVRTMSKGISFASGQNANQHSSELGGDPQGIAWMLGDLLNRDASICFLTQACPAPRTDSTRIDADMTGSSAAHCKSSKHTRATATGAVVQRSR